ncbi:unnamed protein product [Notodromas monacha]|uniref:HIG1 domain-containing protein n=1 Tax=Notodromas monacha TaxID=399045 RepID=A0A7R9GI59_9CRUS|nr:unnamed protein product [Notodromas monacha]CAG0921454.1 unnamed protein product [Notodromas monacha]
MGSEENKDEKKDFGGFDVEGAYGGRKTLAEKTAENPLVPIGIGGGALAVLLALGGYRKKDPNMKPSVYVIHTRLMAQGLVIGAMFATMAMQLFKNIRKEIQSRKND